MREIKLTGEKLQKEIWRLRRAIKKEYRKNPPVGLYADNILFGLQQKFNLFQFDKD